jgi:hypothetical protein
VNLLVGKNNSGKTAILEGIHLLTTGGNPGIVAEIASRRGESVIREVDEIYFDRWMDTNPDNVSRYPNISHFYHKHRIVPGTSFSISSNREEINIRAHITDINQSHIANLLKQAGNDDKSDAELAMIIQSNFNAKSDKNAYIVPILHDGSFTQFAMRVARRSLKRSIPTTDQLVEYVSPDSLDPSSLATMWDNVTFQGREQEVIRALQILEPTLSDIRFLTGGGRIPSRFAGILVELEDNHTNRLPLGSFGDGMRRLLALAISMIQSTNGVLLVDEIDTGLHYSVMGNLWRLIVEAARQANIQVFATTHSLDCLRGLAWLCDKSPQYHGDISVQRIEQKLDHSVCFPGNEIALAIEEDVEIR